MTWRDRLLAEAIEITVAALAAALKTWLRRRFRRADPPTEGEPK